MGCGANREETERTKCPIVAKPARMGHPSVTGLWLACIIVAIVVVAPSRFSISKPCIQVAKLCVLRFAKDIFVGKNPPSVQTFPPLLAALNPFHFGIVHKVFDHWTNCDVLTRADDGGPLRDIGKGEREIFWQRDWQYRRICSERNFMGGRKPGIDHGRDGLKFQVLRSLLIDRTTDDNAESEFDEVPIICRFILAILGVLCGFFLSLLGWNCFDNKRRLLGAALVSTGWPLGALGFLLLWLTSFPSTWHWIL